MINWTSQNTKKLTDFNVGSATRTLLEAVSLQLEEFYFKMYQNIIWAIENSIYKAFGFELRGAKAATGYVRITFRVPLKQPYVVTKGTSFATTTLGKTKYFKVVQDTIIAKGASLGMVLVECTEKGVVGNISANSLTIMVTPNSEIQAVTNPYNFNSGYDSESSSERKKRFLLYIQTLARGTTDAISYGCLEVEGVDGVWIDDSEIGVVRAYVHDSDGNLSEELKQSVKDNVKNYRAAGVEVEILPVIKKTVDVSIVVYIGEEYDTSMYHGIITTALYKYLDSFQVSKDLYISEMVQYTMNIDDAAIVNTEIQQPYNDVIARQQELIRAGIVSIEVKSVTEQR